MQIRFLRYLLLFLPVLASSTFLFSQNQPPVSDARALALASQSIGALNGGTSISDVTLSGTATWSNGSASETANAALMAKGTGESRFDMALSAGLRSEVRNDASTDNPAHRLSAQDALRTGELPRLCREDISKEMRDIRRVLCWIFGFNALAYSLLFVRSMYRVGSHYTLLTSRDLLVIAWFQFIEATVTGVAWWIILKQKGSARAWGIAASIVYLLSFVRPFIFASRSVSWHDWGALFIGVGGLIAFLWPDVKPDRGHF